MCGWWYPRFNNLKELLNKHAFHIFDPKFPSWQHKKQVKERKGIIPSCNIHTVKVETLGRGSKGGGKEELGEEEWVSLNTLSLRKTKIWQDYSTSLELKRGEEMGFFFVSLEWMRGGYI